MDLLHEVLISRFKEFRTQVENLTGKKINFLRLDNGEYTSNEFSNFCKEVGIKRELTVPYNPQQNGVAERKNRTICEAAKAMITDLDLTLSLWADATGTAVYIQNRSPCATLGEKTPKEVFTKKKPAVDHMRIFGHVPKEKRAKLEPSGKKGIFVGYSDCSKSYRVYIPGQRHIEVSKYVIFHEEAVFRKTLELSSEDTIAPLEFPDLEIQREEEFDDQTPNAPERIGSPLEELLEVPPSKRRPSWYRETVQEVE